MITPDLGKVVPVSQMKGEDAEDTLQLNEMSKTSRNYLTSFKWCKRVVEEYFGLGIGGIVAVFLYRIEPARENIDEWIWVIIGDIPPAYIATTDAPNPASALDSYIGEMERWVEAVKKKIPLDEVIPVNAPPTPEYAKMLQSRLEYLDREILSLHKDDLSVRGHRRG